MTEIGSHEKEDISFFNEVIRKATHLGALIVPGGYYVLQLEKNEMLAIMVPISLLMFIIDIARLRNWKFWTKFASKFLSPIIREHEMKGDFTGASYILMSFCLTIALYSKPIAVTAISFIIVGDSFAALLGRRFGKIKFYRNKTIAGSVGCLIGMLIVAVLVPDMYLPIAIIGAVFGTIFEAFSFGVDDNVTVPILSGLFMTLFQKLLF
jgi:dolichol kinase